MRTTLLTLLLIAATCTSSAQNWRYFRHEFYGGVGASQFLGELGGNKGEGRNGFASVTDLEWALTRYVGTLGYRFKLNPAFAIRAAFTFARVDGDDKRTDNPFRKNRNLHFKSPIYELALGVEWYPLSEKIGHPYRMSGTRGKKVRHLSPYVFAGVGGLYFNPKARYLRTGPWEPLAPYQTEGVSYSRFTAALLYGAGLKYSLNKQWSIGFEFGMRKTFTDYMDDVSGTYIDNSSFPTAQAAWFADPSLELPEATSISGPISAGQQRGDASDLDSYMFAILSVHYRLLKGRINLPKF